jgi:hypothetical protein
MNASYVDHELATSLPFHSILCILWVLIIPLYWYVKYSAGYYTKETVCVCYLWDMPWNVSLDVSSDDLVGLCLLPNPCCFLFHFSFLILRQSVGLLGRGIGQSQGRYLHRIKADRHPWLELDSNRRSQCSSGHCDLLFTGLRSVICHKIDLFITTEYDFQFPPSLALRGQRYCLKTEGLREQEETVPIVRSLLLLNQAFRRKEVGIMEQVAQNICTRRGFLRETRDNTQVK